jgi:hypothetical protein
MYERRGDTLLPRAAFLRRLGGHAAIAAGVAGFSLAVGVLGYRVLEGMPWIDALLNASMILGGMGPVDQLHSTAGKAFASAYALYSGLVVLMVAGVLFAPIIHRLLHDFHVELPEDEE